MNGNPEQTYPEAGPTGAYTGASTPGSADGYSSTAGAYGTAAGSPNYGQGPNYTAGSAGDPYAPGYVPPTGGSIPPYGYPPTPPPPPVPGAPNPGLATLLGFIPGVGAMYNGQFAKGIAHIVIFSIITSLSSHMGDPLDILFGFLGAGWYFYMVFDAYQTARARRDGMVVPDPFGLNNIGERFGMPSSPNWGDFVARPAPAAGTPAADPTRPADSYSTPPVPPVANATVPPPYAAYSATTSNPYAGPGMGYGYPEPPFAATAGASYGSTPPYGSAPGYGNTYAPPIPPVPPMPMNPGDATRSGLPVGAFWLIGLGLLALVGTLGHNYYFVPRYFGGIIPIALGIGIIIQRALAAKRFYPEGSAAHTWYILHQSRVGVVLIAVGGLTLLSSMSLLRWHHSWPYLLILFGLMQVADRAAYNRMLAETPIPAPYATGPVVPPAAEASSTESNGQEAR